MPRFVTESIRNLVTDLVPSQTWHPIYDTVRDLDPNQIRDLLPSLASSWQQIPYLVRTLVPRLVPNLVMDLVPDLAPDQMPNLILVVPDLVSQIWYQICPRDLVLDLVPDLAADLEPDRQSDLVHHLLPKREQIWYQSWYQISC